jgi:TetR/AcrR family transcriptional repressor of nem operon
MRYEKGRKDETRQRIIAAAAKRFREEGVEAVGVAGLMADAGLTHGGFYSHFPSKVHLVRETLTTVLDRRHARLEQSIASGRAGVETIIANYLSQHHRDNPGTGCPFACFVGEIARRPDETRTAFTDKLKRHAELIAAHFTSGPEAEREHTALTLLSLMSGALQLSRAVSDRALSQTILETARQSALEMVKDFTGES